MAAIWIALRACVGTGHCTNKGTAGVHLPLFHIIIYIGLWTVVLVAYSVIAPRLGLAGTPAALLPATRQDDQINCLVILSIFAKQRTYLTTLPNRCGPDIDFVILAGIGAYG